MITLMVLHEVDDVELWLASPKRKELFGALQGDQAAEAMKHDGVRPDTILELVEG